MHAGRYCVIYIGCISGYTCQQGEKAYRGGTRSISNLTGLKSSTSHSMTPTGVGPAIWPTHRCSGCCSAGSTGSLVSVINVWLAAMVNTLVRYTIVTSANTTTTSLGGNDPISMVNLIRPISPHDGTVIVS